MKRSELAEILKKEYKKGLPCGICKVSDPRYQNLWFVVPPAPSRVLTKRLPIQALSRAHRVIENLPVLNDANELDQMISYLFVRREAVQSSRMEGTWSTIDHVLTPSDLYQKKEGFSERFSVLGYAHAIENEIKNCEKKGIAVFDEKLICRIHKDIMRKDPFYRGKAGEFRATRSPGSIVTIGGLSRPEDSVYNPPPPAYVSKCLKEVLAWMCDEELVELGNAGMGLSLPVRLAVGHAHFEGVHPFRDGNGRVGRVLLTLQIVCHGKLPLYLSGYIEQEKEAYVKSLGLAQKKLEYGPVIEFICESLVASFEEAEETRSLIKALPLQWAQQGGFREGSAAQRTLTHLIHQPVFSVKNIAQNLSISMPAAQRAVVR